MKSKPIVIFSTSETPNWSEDDCKKKPADHRLTTEERMYLHLYETTKSARDIATTSKNNINKEFASVVAMFKSYKMSGKTKKIEFYDHCQISVYFIYFCFILIHFFRIFVINLFLFIIL